MQRDSEESMTEKTGSMSVLDSVPGPVHTPLGRRQLFYKRRWMTTVAAAVVSIGAIVAAWLVEYPSTEPVPSTQTTDVLFSDPDFGFTAPFRSLPSREPEIGISGGAGASWPVVYAVHDLGAPQQISVGTMSCIPVPERTQALLAEIFDVAVAGLEQNQNSATTRVLTKTFMEVQGSPSIRGSYSVGVDDNAREGELLIVARGAAWMAIHVGWDASADARTEQQQRDFVSQVNFNKTAPAAPSCGPAGGSFPNPAPLS